MLVGRQAERQELERLVASARLGTSGVLAVAGEAGVGKSALLADILDRHDDMRVLRATGLESEREIPFGMLLQLLRPALDLLDAIPPMQADALAAALAIPRAGSSGTGERPDRFAIGAAVLSLVCRYAEDGPVAVVVDDLHLADTPSVNALTFAARRLSADPIVVLLGARTPEGEAVIDGLSSLRIGGVDLDAARLLITEALGAGAAGVDFDERVRALHRATDGNPLALLELGATDSDVTESLDTDLPLRVPRAIVEAFGRRLEKVDAGCRAVLLVAAVCGADLRLIAGACEVLGVDVSLLADAEDQGLVTIDSGRIEFRHPLLRAAVYSSGSPQERRAAHRAAADALSETDRDRRAWHLSEAEWRPDEKVAGLLVEAGENALTRGAYSVAAGAFERAARMTPDDRERSERLFRAADHAWAAGNADRASALLDEWERDAGAHTTAQAKSRAIALRASIAARTGSLREARDILLLAADHAEADGALDDAARALAEAVHEGLYLGDAREAAVLADRLSGLQTRLVDPTARALALMATGMARILSGSGGADDIRAAVPLLEADPAFRRDPRRISWLLNAPLFLRDSTGGAQLRTIADEVRGAAGVGALVAALFYLARDQATSGAAWARAEANYSEAIRLAHETGQNTEHAMALAGLTALESRAGHADACRAHAAEALALCEPRDIHLGEVWVDHALGDLELSLGNAERAVAQLGALSELLSRLSLDDVDIDPGPVLTDALLRLGRREEARRTAHEYRSRAIAKGQPWALARAHRACGLAADERDIDEWFTSALDCHERTLDRFEVARTRLAYGERLRRAGRRVDARVPLRTAAADFAELGAKIWGDRAIAELSATGEHVHATSASVIADLTPQELQVSLLLAEGSTTREAAASLFLSPKTVEYHLRKVYVKLGIGSRGELADVLLSAAPQAEAVR